MAPVVLSSHIPQVSFVIESFETPNRPSSFSTVNVLNRVNLYVVPMSVYEVGTSGKEVCPRVTNPRVVMAVIEMKMPSFVVFTKRVYLVPTFLESQGVVEGVLRKDWIFFHKQVKPVVVVSDREVLVLTFNFVECFIYPI